MPNSDPSARQRQQHARRLRNLAKAAIACGCPGDHTIDNIDIENLTQRPEGRAPAHHYWDPWLADWRNKQTHAPFVSHEHQQRLRAAAHAAAVERDRLRHRNKARCNDDILKPGVDLTSVKPHEGGKLGEEMCAY